MPDEGSLINIDLGGFTKPATVLIERVSDAVGGIFKPWQIKRVAEAEVQTEVIRAEGQIKISETERRGLERLVREEGQKQENIENITMKAIPHLAEDANPEDVDKDWYTHFFDRSRLVSNDEMQTLWSQILAGQANVPGSFSKKTVDMVASMEKSDAELFTQIYIFMWMFNGLTPLMFDYKHRIFNRAGINYGRLMHLGDLGLLTLNNRSFTKILTGSGNISISYYGRPISIEVSRDIDEIEIGIAVFTRTGAELAKICGSTPNEDFYAYVVAEYRKMGYQVTTP